MNIRFVMYHIPGSCYPYIWIEGVEEANQKKGTFYYFSPLSIGWDVGGWAMLYVVLINFVQDSVYVCEDIKSLLYR